MNLMALVDDYIESAILRPKTVDNYRGAARMLIVHLGQDIPIDHITSEQLLRFRENVLKRALPQT